MSYQTTDVIIAHIYTTTDYDQFTYPAYTRSLTDSRTKTMIKAIQQSNDPVSPIEVLPTNGKLLILDGQARLAALRALHLPVTYYLTPSSSPTRTIYLDRRNNSRHWTVIDRIHSYATNPHNFTDPKQQAQVQQQYRLLSDLIQESYHYLGRIPVLALLQQIQGINSAIDQQFDPQQTDYKLGYFKVKNAKQFMLTIHRFADLMSAIPYQRISSAFFKAVFAIMADQAINADYFAQLVNHQHDQFALIVTQPDATEMLLSLIKFYNANIQTWKKRGPKPRPIAATLGPHGKVKLTGRQFHQELFL